MAENSDQHCRYRSPLAGRYSSPEMLELFSEKTKIKTWRKLWTCLAQAQKELGLEISQEQIDELVAAQEKIDFSLAESIEKETRHDVMAHIKTFEASCPSAGGILHLGATSCYVGDNTDIIIMREACTLLRKRLINLINDLSSFAFNNRQIPTLAYTHFQPAQLTTVGKRASIWLQDLVIDFEDLEYFIKKLALRGAKGTTGTQASYLKLFNGDHKKVKMLDEYVTKLMGFQFSFPVTGQTYPRKIDAKLISILAGVAASASKFSSDIRLLAHERELEEPFLKSQIGSSAMAYKRNPMRCERISSLSRFIISLIDNPFQTAANQWLERTLDDSAGKRLVIPESFLAVDAVLNLYHSVVRGIVINHEVIKNNMHNEISFMATENILMDAVQAGGNRQELHEKIRFHSMEAVQKMKDAGEPCDLIERLKLDDSFVNVMKNTEKHLNPINYIGRSCEQVEEFIASVITPLIDKHSDNLEEMEDLIKV